MHGSVATWPALPAYAAWKDSHAALWLCCQVVGKYRLARTPWVPQSWHATLYPVPRGLTTGPVPDAGGSVEMVFDLREGRLILSASNGRGADIPLGPTSLADFDARLREAVSSVGGTPRWHQTPNEVADPVPFQEDHETRPWDASAIGRFHVALLTVARVFDAHRTAFLGKVSPAHLFWGSFDLAVTRFSGRLAPRHPGGIPNLPDAVTREAYSHEVQSSGFWAGGGPSEDAAFYAYAYPRPHGFEGTELGVPGATWSEEASEFVLPYEAVRSSAEPEATLLRFLDAAYQAAAIKGGWDKTTLDCPRGEPGAVRPIAR